MDAQVSETLFLEFPLLFGFFLTPNAFEKSGLANLSAFQEKRLVGQPGFQVEAIFGWELSFQAQRHWLDFDWRKLRERGVMQEILFCLGLSIRLCGKRKFFYRILACILGPSCKRLGGKLRRQKRKLKVLGVGFHSNFLP